MRHRDALPDDGGEEDQRRLTAIVYANAGWLPENGGCLRVWAPPGSQIASGCEASKPGGRGDEGCAAAGGGGAAGPLQGAPDDACSSGASGSGSQAKLPGQCRVVDGEAAVDIEPLAGRLVLMLSGAVDHAVLPVSQPLRVALTAWLQ